MNKTPAIAHVMLLGSFQIKIDERTLSVLDTGRATALLAYLLVENQPQRRERLAALFWPEMTEKRARANLSQAIYALRKHLEFDENLALFHSDTRTIQLNPNYPISSDIGLLRQAFCGCVLHQPHLNEDCTQCLTALHQQLGLLRGEFLDGLSLPACADFEAWLREQRQLFLQKSTTLCRKVALWLLRTGESEQAGALIQRWISLDPFDEEVQLINLRLLLQNGQRNAAVLAFENYRRLLQRELDSEPSAQLSQLYAQIQAATTPATTPAIPQSPHLHALNLNPPSSALNFVGRSGELAQLQSHLAAALAGNGQISFVTGEAGFGKSALLQAFARQTAQQFPQMITLLGNCNAYTGLGDPYLPIRELLSLLVGDVETQQRAGAISSEQAAHLRNVAPSAIRGLVELAPDLVGTLLIPSRLLTLATTLLADQSRLEEVRKLVAQKERERAYANAHGNNNGRTQSALFEQMTKLLQHLATQQPLLLLLDDLHWADMGTIALLFHLSRNLQQSRVLIVGTFRPAEVMAAHNSSGQVGPSAGHHPLEAIYHELQRQFGKIEIALEEADGQSFVNDLLDRQVNRLDQTFRQRLYQYTHGNAATT